MGRTQHLVEAGSDGPWTLSFVKLVPRTRIDQFGVFDELDELDLFACSIPSTERQRQKWLAQLGKSNLDTGEIHEGLRLAKRFADAFAICASSLNRVDHQARCVIRKPRFMLNDEVAIFFLEVRNKLLGKRVIVWCDELQRPDCAVAVFTDSIVPIDLVQIATNVKLRLWKHA